MRISLDHVRFGQKRPLRDLLVAANNIDGLFFAATARNRYGLRAAARSISDPWRISMHRIPGDIICVSDML